MRDAEIQTVETIRCRSPFDLESDVGEIEEGKRMRRREVS